MTDGTPAAGRRVIRGSATGFRVRLVGGLVVVALLPLLTYGIVALALAPADAATALVRILLLVLAAGVVLAVAVGALLATVVSGPLRALARAVEDTAAGDLAPIEVAGDDELARLAESHNRLAADLERRNRELRRIVEALEETTPGEPVEVLVARAADRARTAFGLLDAAIHLGDPASVPAAEAIPGEARPVRAVLSAAGEPLGVLVGRLPATRRWDPADRDLLDLYASEVAAAIRNAQLYARVGEQNARLVELGAAKDDFLRGVSHNLQTPLASIRAYAEQLAAERPDRRLGIVVEQGERLSRMVRQLLTVSRLESGALQPRAEVVAVAPRVRRTWEALGHGEVPFVLEDASAGWLAIADGDQLDQVLWALLDNAVGHGGRAPVTARLAVDEAGAAPVLATTIADGGPGVPEADRGRLFARFARGGDGSREGSGLGLYVSRELCRAMGGDLVLEPAREGAGAAFTIRLPAERAEES